MPTPADPARPRILFFAEAVTLAHLGRPLKIAKDLDPQEFDIHFACPQNYAFALEELDAVHWPLESLSSQEFLRRLSTGRPIYDYATLTRYVAQDLKLIEEIAPAAIFGDLRLSLAVSAVKTGVPYFAIANAHWSPYAEIQRLPVPDHLIARMFGVAVAKGIFHALQPAILKRHARPFNRLRENHGLSPLGDLRHVYTFGDHVLYSDSFKLVPTRERPPHHHYMGPVLWSPTTPLPAWWPDLDPARPLAYVTLGSSGKTSALPGVIEALKSLEMDAIVATAGRVILSDLPPHIHSADYLPGDLAARKADFVICNGGSATVYQALNEGKPVIGIASNLDQHLTMAYVTRAGAGATVRSERATAKRIRDAIGLMLRDAQYTEAAETVATDFARYDSASLIERLLNATLRGAF